MSYLDSYKFRYEQSWLSQRAEVSIIKSAQYIKIEDPGTPDHANRLAWAQWALRNSSVAIVSFMWGMAVDPNVLAKGQDITDPEIDSITSAELPDVLADFAANPPAGA
jgi:hypothetical protein